MKKWLVTFKFVIIKFILFIVFLVAFYSLIISIRQINQIADRLNVIAASLSVITAVISAFLAVQIFQNREEENQPKVHLEFDVTSRYMLAQLFVTNLGGSTAYNININWDTPLTDSEGEKIKFNEKDEDKPDITTLLPNKNVSVMIDSTLNIFKKKNNLKYSGTVNFEDINGVTYEEPFQISLEKFKKSLTHPKEEIRTYYELQKIPKKLDEINKQLKNIKKKRIIHDNKNNSRFAEILITTNKDEWEKITLVKKTCKMIKKNQKILKSMKILDKENSFENTIKKMESLWGISFTEDYSKNSKKD